jgi:hypothetical protein
MLFSRQNVVVAFLTRPFLSLMDYQSHWTQLLEVFTFIKTSFTLGEPVSLVKVFRLFRLGMGFFFLGVFWRYMYMYNIFLSIGKASVFVMMMPCCWMLFWTTLKTQNPKNSKAFFSYDNKHITWMNDDIYVWKELFFGALTAFP